MTRWCLVALIFLSGCSARPPEAPETVYQKARQEIRRGNFDAASGQADRGFRQWGGDPNSLWHWQFHLLRAEVLYMRGKAKEARSLLEAEIPERPEFRELVARRRLHQGRVAFLLSEYPESKKLLDEALELASALGSPTLIAEVELRRISALVRLGDFAASEASFRNAIQIGIRQGDPYWQTAALINLGFGLMNDHARYDEAIPLFERALPVAKKMGNRSFVATTLGNLGRCYYSLGDWGQALKFMSEAEAMAAQIGNLRGRQIWLGGIAHTYYSQRDFRTAIAYYQRALALARELGEPFSIVDWLNNLSSLSMDAGDLPSAEAYNREAVALSQQMENRDSRMWSLLGAARIAAAKKQLEQAERLYSDVIGLAGPEYRAALWEAQAGLANLFVAGQQWPKANQHFQLALSTIETSRARLARVEWKFTFLAQLIRFYQDYVDFLMERGQPRRALEVAESARALVLAEKLGLKQVSQRKASASQFQQQARALNAVLLSYWLAPRRSFLWVVTPDKVHSFSLPPDKDVSQLVESYTNLILQLRDPLETLNAAGSRLFEVLVAPAQKLVRPGANVIIVPAGSLYELNFETLLTNQETPRYWIEEAIIAIAPSLAVLQPEDRTSGNERRLLLLGSPVPPGPEYPPLPASELEVAKIQDVFRTEENTVVTGPQAHPGAYREASPERFTLIHFSAHAVANRESPLDSAVILSRKQDSYKLYARDVAALPLRAELVTISACRSAGARTYSGEGLVGFTWAFLQAGARNVIAGLWDVADRSTSDLMIQLYAGLANGLSPAEALRSAKLALARSNSAYRKPYYWAPFQLYSRSAPFSNRPLRAAR